MVELRMDTLEMDTLKITIHTHTTITEKKRERFFFSFGGGVNYNILQKKAGIELLATFGVKRQCINIGYDFVNQTPRLRKVI
jgi:mevalonate pyrophosphate decarboxylase